MESIKNRYREVNGELFLPQGYTGQKLVKQLVKRKIAIVDIEWCIDELDATYGSEWNYYLTRDGQVNWTKFECKVGDIINKRRVVLVLTFNECLLLLHVCNIAHYYYYRWQDNRCKFNLSKMKRANKKMNFHFDAIELLQLHKRFKKRVK